MRILQPIAGSIVSEIVTVTALANDNEGIRKVNLWIDGYPIEETDDTQEPYEFRRNTLNYADNSQHILTVRVFDRNDNVTDSDPVQVLVDNSSAYPTKVEITRIEFKNKTFIINWNQSPDADFAMYKLYESNDI